MSSHVRLGLLMTLRPHCRPSVLCLLLSLLLWCTLTIQGSTLGERDFSRLTSEQILALVAAKDPVANVDPNNPSSHLSKILIPRAGMCPLVSQL